MYEPNMSIYIHTKSISLLCSYHIHYLQNIQILSWCLAGPDLQTCAKVASFSFTKQLFKVDRVVNLKLVFTD